MKRFKLIVHILLAALLVLPLVLVGQLLHNLLLFLGIIRRPQFWSDWSRSSRPTPKLSAFAPRLLGEYTLSLAARHAPAASLQSALLSGMELATPAGVPEGLHPMILVLGYQQNVRPAFTRIFKGIHYLEAAVAIPYVRLAQEPNHLFLFLTHVHIERLLPILVGRIIGYPKQWARIATKRSSYEIETRRRQRILAAGFTISGPEGAPADFPNFAPIRQQLDQTLVSQTKVGFCFTHLDFQFQWARMQPVEMELEVFTELPGLPAGFYRQGSINDSPLGVCRVQVPWVLRPPFEPDESSPR